MGLASMLFKEKQMGVIRVHGILPVRRSMFILSKLLLLFLSDLTFTVLLTVVNLGIPYAINVLPGVLLQAGILSLIMALFCTNGRNTLLFNLLWSNYSFVPACLSDIEPRNGKGGLKDERIKVSTEKYSP